MNLSLYTGGVKPYLEYGWVCAPNTAAQEIVANTITTLTVDTEVADTGGFGSIASNQITLAAGTYYFKAFSTMITGAAGAPVTMSLFNVSSSQYVTRGGVLSGGSSPAISTNMEGQFTISSSSVFTLRVIAGAASFVLNAFSLVWNGSASVPTPSSNSTAGADQRTTIKLWKLA